MAFDINRVLDTRCLHGEGPFWHHQQRRLYWVDILTPTLYCYSADSKKLKQYPFSEPIGFAIPVHDNSSDDCPNLVVGLQSGLALYDTATRALAVLTNPERDLPNNRFNDGKCDAHGRLWAGTMDCDSAKDRGSLYLMNNDRIVSCKDENYSITNGPAWSTDDKTLYHNDTAEGVIYAFDYDLANAAITNKRIFYKFSVGTGAPDGMTVDCDNNLWVACAQGGRIICLSPRAELLHTINLPVSFITSCAFGGENLDQLFVTTSRLLDEDRLTGEPDAGAIFSIDLRTHGIRGLPGNACRITPPR